MGRIQLVSLELFWFLATLLVPLSATGWAQGGSEIWTSSFSTDSGTRAQLQSYARGNPIFVSFWASWCAPCRAELRELLASRKRLSGLDIIAVNIDDESSAPAARAFLDEIGWDFISLRDVGGAVFYQFQTSGELPLSLLFEPNGRTVARFAGLSESSLAQLEAASQPGSTASAGDENRPWTIGVQTQGRSQKVEGRSSPAAVLTNSSTVSWQGSEATVSVTHDLLRQRYAGKAGWTRFEDEIGTSYGEWRPQAGVAGPLERLRIGDGSVSAMDGLLLSARHRPDSNEAASLAGLHVDATQGSLALEAHAGRLRDRLYPYVLDASRDLSTKDLDERAATIAARVALSPTVHAEAGAAGYRRGPTTPSVVNAATADERYGLKLGWGNTLDGIDARAVRYSIEKRGSAESPRSESVHLSLRAAPAPMSRFSVDLLRGLRVPPRVLLPRLVEEPFLSLETVEQRTARLTSLWIIEAVGTISMSVVTEDDASAPIGHGTDRQTTTSIRWVSAVKAIAVLLGEQHAHLVSADRTSTERALTVSGDLPFGLHANAQGQVYGSRSVRDQGVSNVGRRTGLRMDADLQKMTDLFNSGPRLFLGAACVRQDGTYVALSQVDGRFLATADASLATRHWRFRLAVGRAPGGVVCSGGTCAPRPPLNGSSLNAEWETQF